MPYKDPLKQKAAQKEYYLKNRSIYYSRSQVDKKKRRAYIAKLKERPCMDCRIQYPFYVMDLDHRENEIKLGGIAQIIIRYGWETILKEIEKCDIVCSNCHRIRTYNREQRYKNNGDVAQRQSNTLSR